MWMDGWHGMHGIDARRTFLTHVPTSFVGKILFSIQSPISGSTPRPFTCMQYYTWRGIDAMMQDKVVVTVRA
jgi:hypothetical protein